MAQAPEPFDFNGTEPLPKLTDSPSTSGSLRLHRASLNANDIRSSATPPSSSNAPPSSVDSNGRYLNPRSCVTCRKRKVKCDKLHPCSNCTRAHIECIFPTPGRAPRKPKKPVDGKDAELLARLRRLEGVVKHLGVDVGPDGTDEGKEEAGKGSDGAAQSQSNNLQGRQDERWAADNQHGRFENRFGRLVVNEGRSRYVNNSFWANLSNEVEDLKGILNEDSEDDADQDSPTSAHHVQSHHGWVFNFSSQNVDLLALHPIPVQIETYWRIYKERVDPLVKVLHIPSIEPTVLAAASHLANLSKGFEALLFAMYYGAATSMSVEDCYKTLGEDREVLLTRYRFAVEQALARANFLTTEEIVVLQAFVIFLICLRRNSDARVIWTLTGLIVRMSQTIGIHRDGSHFGLAPFEIEMRRRLWWQVCILDIRASEDHGCDPTIVEQSFDTRMPLNINDTDLLPNMKALPKERQGCTDMTFCLIRFEVANTFRRLNYIPPGSGATAPHTPGGSLEDKERWITACHERLEAKYLQNVDMTVPIYWVTATVARLMMSKMWLMVYHPFQRQSGGAGLPEEIRDKLFITSLENMEYSTLLQTEARTMKWGWLFRTYMQWHALAFILSELTHRARGELVDRAWLAVDRIRDGRHEDIEASEAGKSGHLWKPLMRLMTKAKAARAKALEEDGVVLGKQSKAAKGKVLSGSTVETLQAQRKWPGMVTAPLSQRQVARYMTPRPAYGSTPIDTTKLLQSPVLKDVTDTDDLMDTSTLFQDVLQQPLPPNVQAGASGMQDWQGVPNMEGINTSPADQAAYSGFAFSPIGGAQMNGDSPIFTSDRPSSTGISPIVNGELDWANWDQLVRQFGMDVDETPGTGQAGTWAAPNWSATPYAANNMGSTMGMGPSDGFW